MSFGYHTPKILFYARFDYDPKSGKTPKYVMTHQAGYYPVMESLTGRDGKICLYLLPSGSSGSKKDKAPAMRLQAKDSFNLTGLKDYFKGGKLSGVAYGCPPPFETYGTIKKKTNPFFEHKEDGFLFVVHHNEVAIMEADKVRPSCLELIVLEGAKALIPSYCQQLKKGGFNEDLNKLRTKAELQDLSSTR